jgi:NADH-quinone oxidoreductase subunit N
MVPTFNDFYNILPLIVVALGILISLCIEMFFKKSKLYLPWFSVAVFLAAAFHSLYYADKQAIAFNGMVASGGTANIFYFIFNFGAAIVVLLSIDYLKKVDTNYGEFYILLQSAVLGMMMMASAKDLIMIFIGLEQMSICFYILAGFNRKKIHSNEAALKYFLLGAFATGFIVYGIALIYGTSTTMSLNVIYSSFPVLSKNILFVVGLLLFIIGFAFKVAAFPFHMWVPDVYQGSPTNVTALMSTIGKAAAFSAIIIIFIPIASGLSKNIFFPFIAVLAVFSMIYGSIVAIAQTDVKRMLAYSSIGHAGYMLIGIAAGNSTGLAGIVFYLAAYTFMNLGAFGAVSLIEGKNDSNLDINSYAGLGNRNSVLAALVSIFMFALSGIPPFAGFFGKYYIFISAIQANQTWLAIIGVISSVISVYFYLRIVVLMYFKESENYFVIHKSTFALFGVVISSLIVILMGISPNVVINLISQFIK